MAGVGLTAPGVSTWDIPGVAGRRPGLPDVNGLALVDNANKAPTSPTRPSANLLNTGDALAVAYGRLVPNARVSVAFAAGSPFLVQATLAPTAGNTSPGTALAILRTPSFVAGFSAAGDTIITYAPNILPGPITQPSAYLNIVIGLHNYSIGCVPITLAPSNWVTATVYALNAYIQPSAGNANGYFYQATAVAGTHTSGGTEPVWPTVIGATVVDNSGANQITWTCIGGLTGVRVTTAVDQVLTDEAYTAETW